MHWDMRANRCYSTPTCLSIQVMSTNIERNQIVLYVNGGLRDEYHTGIIFLLFITFHEKSLLGFFNWNYYGVFFSYFLSWYGVYMLWGMEGNSSFFWFLEVLDKNFTCGDGMQCFKIFLHYVFLFPWKWIVTMQSEISHLKQYCRLQDIVHLIITYQMPECRVKQSH